MRTGLQWLKARAKTHGKQHAKDILILCLSPEQFISKGFTDILVSKPFVDCLCSIGVDEIHLLGANISWCSNSCPDIQLLVYKF
jgi:hypothetical protein